MIQEGKTTADIHLQYGTSPSGICTGVMQGDNRKYKEMAEAEALPIIYTCIKSAWENRRGRESLQLNIWVASSRAKDSAIFRTSCIRIFPADVT